MVNWNLHIESDPGKLFGKPTIINTRISRGLPVIINTNLTPEELEQKYSQRITSGIIGNYKSLQFCGRDIRQLKKRL